MFQYILYDFDSKCILTKTSHGAISINGNNITLFNITMLNNKALLFGGAIIAQYSQLQMTNSILQINSAVYVSFFKYCLPTFFKKSKILNLKLFEMSF